MSGLLLLLALGAIAVMAFGHRVGAQPGLLILFAAGAVSFVPGIPRFELEPEAILGVVVPPLLYAATLEFSFGNFMRNLRSILGLGVVLVGLTALVTGYVTAWLIPGAGLAAAFVLASIVAPPDTVVIAAHGAEIGLPRRVSAILTGESLVNDAAALTLFSVCVAWAAGTGTFIANPVLLFGYSAVLGFVVGMLLGHLASWVRNRLGDPTLETALGIVLPFAVFFAAEHLHASGVLAVVAAGFTVAMHSHYADPRRGRRLGYRTRLAEREIWPVMGTLLEAFVFAYTGLQLRFVIDELRESEEAVGRTILAGLVILIVVVLVRLAWIFLLFGRGVLALRVWERRMAGFAEMLRLRPDLAARVRGRTVRAPDPLSARESLLVGWCGMRGIVTLGAAGGIPLTTAAGAAFPHRSTLQFLAYVVVIGTLAVQGPTLPLLARRLRIDTTGEDAEARADLAAAEARIQNISGYEDQRNALSVAVSQRAISDEAARTVLNRIDRREAAGE